MNFQNYTASDVPEAADFDAFRRFHEIPPHNALLNDWESIYFSENVIYSPADPPIWNRIYLFPPYSSGI